MTLAMLCSRKQRRRSLYPLEKPLYDMRVDWVYPWKRKEELKVCENHPESLVGSEVEDVEE